MSQDNVRSVMDPLPALATTIASSSGQFAYGATKGMSPNLVPKDSCLRLWLDRLRITEIPVSYQIVSGMIAIGSSLRRCIYVDQEEWKVFPNLSALLVGPSGIGKDLAIAATEDVIQTVGAVRSISGRTIEYLKAELLDVVPPAACYVPAPELTAFLGGKDYQKSMVQELTDLMSTGKKVDASTKSERNAVIIEPTLSVHAGSTEAWLVKAMPDGSLEGGFFPRFVVLCEEYGQKHVAWVKYSNTQEDKLRARKARDEFYLAVAGIVRMFEGDPAEMVPTQEAIELYDNWYQNRFKYFSKLVAPYANRSRDQVHRMALICAASRAHRYLEAVDYVFAQAIMDYVALSIDKVIKPMIEQQTFRRNR